MFKNMASQKITFLVIDTTTNLPKTDDAANLTAYVSIDDGAVTQLTDTSATELSSTNAPGLYTFDVTQAETNGDKLVFSGKSSTSGVRVVPVTVYTLPASFTSLNVTNVNTLASHDPGTTIGTSTLTQAQVTGGAYALNSASFAFNAALDFTTTQKAATLADTSGTTTLLSRLSATRAGYLDNLSGGAVALASGVAVVSIGAGVITATSVAAGALNGKGDWNTAAPLDAAGTRSAVGLASANLDTQLASIKSDTAAILDDTGTSGVVIADKTGFSLASTGLNSVLIDGKTLPAAVQIVSAIVAGKVTGAGTGTETFKGLDGATTRVVVTVDSSGNRSGVVYS